MRDGKEYAIDRLWALSLGLKEPEIVRKMEEIFDDFRAAQTQGSGPLLSTSLVPVAPRANPNRLVAFFRSTNALHVKEDIAAQINDRNLATFRLPQPEAGGWIDLYVCFWFFLRDLLTAEDPRNKESDNDGAWTKVYESWKEVTNVLIRGYTARGFQAWTVPCLYVVGKYLRVFAIKADEVAWSVKSAKGVTATFSSGLQDDVASDMGKNDKLEDAGRVMNRIFQLCISDRYCRPLLMHWCHTC